MDSIKRAVNSFGLPRVIILAFFVFLLGMAAFYDLGIPALLGDVIRRWGMFGILVLAMVPAIQSGIGPNFGVSIGIIGGLLGSLISIEMRDMGYFEATANPEVVSVIIALIFAIVFAGIFGFLYGLLLNRVKGSEMVVSTYVGFSMVALFNIMWLLLPFRSGTSIWPIAGEGLRTTISLADDFGGVFNDLLAFELGDMSVPTGLLLVFFLCCFLVWLFTQSRIGMMMRAAGSNPNFARAAGINVNKMRVLGTTLSTILGGIGIVAFAQSFGFLQLYNAPLMMGFTVVASVLVGGASVVNARIFNVLLGTFLFQGILTVAIPVANQMVPEGNLSEILRMIISNGIILYALSKSREATR
ncbi:MAG: ABC transporter permease [Oscillospiraceae bacterium]|nr:ABC transporter permease [Oscillospiraceae bacterium]